MAIDNSSNILTIHQIKPNNSTSNNKTIKVRMNEVENTEYPAWARPLLEAKYYVQCKLHDDSHKTSECNLYCLDCIHGPLCSFCLLDHKNHRVIQIRKSSYHNVIRVCEIQKLLDISGVQTYVINSAKVVFLNERPQSKAAKGATYMCEVCDRGLLDSFRFCSLGCKIFGKSKKSLTKVEQPRLVAAIKTSSSSDNNDGLQSEKGSFDPLTPPIATPPIAMVKVNKRKGIPHRAPFY